MVEVTFWDFRLVFAAKYAYFKFSDATFRGGISACLLQVIEVLVN